ncbi:MAG: DUF5009 domain-containing protein [Tidjanibacter sp.]|nr:DUF5009 domain-containing protein [Tidjanibacter sp.]
MEQKITGRLDSIDALRGFDMFFITGGAALIRSLAKVWPTEFMQGAAGQMTHMAWNGFAFYDMIFPLFLFITGISFPFSCRKNRANNLTDGHIVGKIVVRTLKLIALGLVFNGFLRLDFGTMRYVSVLGRIGIAWGIAAIIYVNSSRRAIKWYVTAILVVYGLLNLFMVAPDAPTGTSPLSIEGSIVGYIDRMWLPGRLLDGNFDPMGILSTLPAVATALLGMVAGEVVGDERRSPQKRAVSLVIGGVGLTVVGLLIGLIIPINKPLWSSSYVCFTAGLSALMFALFYWLIDIKGYKRWSLYFRVIGLNSITIYMVQKVVDIGKTRDFLFGGIAGLFTAQWANVVLAVGYLAVCYMFLKFLYRKKIFLKV